MINFSLFLVQLITLFFVSRLTIRELFYFLHIFSKNRSLMFHLVSLIFLPGTIVHEMGHFLTAIILMLKVKEVKIFPQMENNTIKLGMVIFEKKDFIRGILVGVAPIFAAFFIFLFLAYFKLFPQDNFILNMFLLYLIFSISSTMFSSKQDLVDLIFIIPLVIIILGVVYVLNIDLNPIFSNQQLLDKVDNIFQKINFYLLLSLIINLILFFFFRGVKFLIKIKK